MNHCFVPCTAFSTTTVLPSFRSAPIISFSRPLRSRHPKLYFCASASSTASVPLSALKNKTGDNGVAISTEFEEAQVFDTIPSSLSSDGNNFRDSVDVKDVIHENTSGKMAKSSSNPSPPPVSNFRLSPSTISRLAEGNITHFTEVQAGTFDLIYDGRDIIAKSRTGTGKTLAFALPIMERLAIFAKQEGRYRRKGPPSCIVLAPTRELAKQVAREMSNIGSVLGLSVECFYGGSSYNTQESALRNGFDILVGTPGRIIDHLDRGTLRLQDIQFAVLDEADEMLSMGFAQDVERIFEDLPEKEARQVILFSATVPSWVKGLASQFQRSDVVTFDAVSTGTKASTTVRHCAVRVPAREEARAGLLADIIAVHSNPTVDALPSEAENQGSVGPSRAIVFTQTKREADELATSGALDGCGAAVLHGDVSQRQREVTLGQFRKGQFQVLVATDVAARGLDISGVDVVVQYRVPMDSESYIHRAGRTGRAGKNGTAVVMYSDQEARRLQTLERECRIKFEQEDAPAPEKALEAAVDVAMANLGTVEDRVRKHLIERAEKILAENDNRVDTIAALLAMAGRRTRLADRSVLSGENGMRTLQVRSREGGSELVVGKALRFISDISRNMGADDRVDVGLIRMCQDGSAVLDVPSEHAVRILDEWKRMKEVNETSHYKLELELAAGVPALKDNKRDSGRGDRMGDRRRGEAGGYSSFGREWDRKRSGGWREDRGERERYRGDRDGGRRGDFYGRGGYSERRGNRDRNRQGERFNGRGGDGRGRRNSRFLEDEF